MSEDLKKRIEKCPSKIKDYILTLERTNKYLLNKISELKGDLKETNTYKDRWPIEERFYLENYSHITFETSEVEVTVNVNLDGAVRIEFGEGYIVPQARNVIYIVGKK